MYKKITYLILILDLSFFYLIPISRLSRNLIANYQKLGIAMIVLLSIHIGMKMLFKYEKYVFTTNILFFILIFINEFILSHIEYKQDIISLITVSNCYLILLAYFFISFYLKKSNDISKLENTIVYFTIIISGVLILQYIIYNLTGNMFLFIDQTRAKTNIRFNGIRIYESTFFIIFGFVLSFGLYLKAENRKLKILYFSGVLISFIQIMLVSKNRMGLVLAAASCIYMSSIKVYKVKIKKYLRLIAFILLVIFLFQLPMLNRFLTSINLNDDSLTIRLDGIKYYTKQIFDNIIFGMGFIKALPGDESFVLVRGYEGKFYKDDMGIIGLVNTFGVVGLVWYLFLVYKVIKILKRIAKNNQINNFIEIYGLCFLVFIGSITNNPLDTQRIVLFPFLLSLLDYSNNSISEITK